MGLFDKIGIDGSYLVIILFILLIGLFLYCLSMRNLVVKIQKKTGYFS